jgi:hypothetical protein
MVVSPTCGAACDTEANAIANAVMAIALQMVFGIGKVPGNMTLSSHLGL